MDYHFYEEFGFSAFIIRSYAAQQEQHKEHSLLAHYHTTASDDVAVETNIVSKVTCVPQASYR